MENNHRNEMNAITQLPCGLGRKGTENKIIEIIS